MSSTAAPKTANTRFFVRTTVFREGTKPRFAPKATVNNVLEAVKHGMEHEYKEALEASFINVDGVQGSAIEEYISSISNLFGLARILAPIGSKMVGQPI